MLQYLKIYNIYLTSGNESVIAPNIVSFEKKLYCDKL